MIESEKGVSVMKRKYQFLTIFALSSLLTLNGSRLNAYRYKPADILLSDIRESTSEEVPETTEKSDSSEKDVSVSSDSVYSSSAVSYSRKVKVYLNPSVQTANLYVDNLGNEGKNMNDICEYMVDELQSAEFIDLKYNLNYLPLAKSVQESNAFNADIHFALHSNAGGGKGSEIYTSSDTRFAEYIYEKYSAIGDFDQRGVKNGSSLYEISHSTAKNRVLLELLFHDYHQEAKFIVDNKERIAHVLAQGIIAYIQEFYFNIYE